LTVKKCEEKGSIVSHSFPPTFRQKYKINYGFTDMHNNFTFCQLLQINVLVDNSAENVGNFLNGLIEAASRSGA
jgi:hypothetical protein